MRRQMHKIPGLRNPSMRTMLARVKNARRIGHLLKRYQREGYLIIDHEGNPVTDPVRLSNGSGTVGLIVGCTAYFICEVNLDNGYHTPIKEFNKWFKKWRIVHPDSFVPLI